jgi:hypothetical protein
VDQDPAVPGRGSDEQQEREVVVVGARPVLFGGRRVDTSELLPRFRSLLDRDRTPSVWRAINKARAHDSHQAFDKLCELLVGEPRIVQDPPLIVPVEKLLADADSEAVLGEMRAFIGSYHRTLCGWTLARAHARSDDRIAIASYLGRSEEFDLALVNFSPAYADQHERDYRLLQRAVASRRVIADAGV